MNGQRDDDRVRQRLRNALTVRELIRELQLMDLDAYPVFRSDYGDRCHTQMALPVGEVVNPENDGWVLVPNDGYSHSGLAMRQPRDDGDEPDDADPESDEMTDDPLKFVILEMGGHSY